MRWSRRNRGHFHRATGSSSPFALAGREQLGLLNPEDHENKSACDP
jgi:hypothetical protein